jgi:hypothetical protein
MVIALRTQARRFDLAPRDHPVLPIGHFRHPPIGRVEFCTHMDA